ncbi:lysophospholipid acyltransferase family protein [Staphylospora marina]|uniref:lysophospholipid acyltransferase family protein n=1 Tax=Staphylospora marina TaxID=2490858 RepID=UPI000F5C0022|nr:lysophospholipid acyltransferase family protein [Staphylospora marina]
MIKRVLKQLLRGFVRLYHRSRMEGLDRMPDGSLIIVGNHVSYLDSFYLGALCPRDIHFMARAESFVNPLSRRFLRMAGAFPVNRAKPEIHTMRTALRLLSEGKVVGIFPEGGIRGDNTFEELKQGAAFLAVRAQCPVIPVFIDGTERALPPGKWWIRPAKVTIRFGTPIHPPKSGNVKERQEQMTQAIRHSLITLKSAGNEVLTG